MGQLQDFIDRLVDSVTGAFSFEVDPDLEPRENVEKVVGETALVAGLIACLQPLPAADLLLLAPLHVKMTLQIGLIKGHEVDRERALDIVKEVAAAAGVTLMVQGLVSAIGKISPFTRALLSFPITYASTWALGTVVDYYFDCMGSGKTPDAAVMKDLFAEQFKVGKKRGQSFDMDEMKRRAEELRAKVSRRDPTLKTETRLEPRPGPKPAASAPSRPAPAPGSKIKITIKPKTEDVPVLAEQAGETPAGGSAKTIGPTDTPHQVEIGFKKAEKTLGEEGDVLIRQDPAPAGAGAGEAKEPPRSGVLPTLGELLPGLAPPPRAPAPATGEEEPGAEPSLGLVDRLERLAALKQSGALTDDEFQRAKDQLLADA